SYLAKVPLTIGASAALCGLIGAALFYGRDRGGLFGQALYRQVGGWALFILLSGFMIDGINNWAHMGGMAAGAASAMLVGYTEKRRESSAHRMVAAICLVVTVLMLLWRIFKAIHFWLQ
ncbi:MAG: rhomboid family intramembrane serine protease, partial [Desulfatitalea sp.]|nr:rhomboid family intramembrane serine protease [Desulfatitalea sp.]NNK01058.1 rhomboid family intramembrane serine protease [Desulfatitalea sp.]